MGPVRRRSSIFVSECLFAPGILPSFRFRRLDLSARSLLGRKCSLLLFWLLYDVLEPALQTVLGGSSSRERVYIRSLRLNLIPICTLLSQPIFFGKVARQVHGLSGALACCVLLFVVDELAIVAPISHVATYSWPPIFLEDFVVSRSERKVSSGQDVVVVGVQDYTYQVIA